MGAQQPADVERPLKEVGHELSPPTVGRLLRKLDYSLHVNSKQLEARSNHPDRDVQFAHIATFKAAGEPIISVDSKKKELIGDFKQAGRTWSLEPIAVNIHDFLGDSLGRAVPDGIYDVLNNRGTVLRWQLGRHTSLCRRRHCWLVEKPGTGSLSDG
jgi:hypothetical protein